jgi:hypothetical protein
VEALYVSPRDGALYLVSKGRTLPIRVYRVTRSAWGDTIVTAARVQTLTVPAARSVDRWITGAAIRPDGALVALRTLTEILLFVPDATGQLQRAAHPPCRFRGLEYQGEAIDFLDDNRLVLASESDARGHPGQLHVIRCPSAGP